MKLTKNDFISNLNELIPDNGTQQISPLDLRTVITNSIDSTVNFLNGQTINAANLGSPETTSTRVGSQALGKIDLPGYITSGNSAFGYQALYGNYQGADNTAIGAFTLGCNLYGDYNVGVGYTALAGNVRGSGNIGLGSHTLQSNKNGDFNIAIGHGAGYYIGDYPGYLSENSYKLYIASTPINSDTTCDIQAGVGPAPLVYGDLKTLKFGIATKTLHSHGTLQVSGDVAPTESGSFNLGNSAYPWGSVNESIHFSGDKIGIGTSTPSGNEGLVTVAGSIVPSQYGTYTLGNSNLAWDGYFNDITVSGAAHIVDLDYVTKEHWIYEAVTLHLGASGGATVGGGAFTGEPYGPIRGYLDDDGADGAGFILHTSGSDYQRDYKFMYKSPDVSLTCLESDSVFSRGRWYSNISLEVENGRHIKTDRIMADDSLSLVSRSGCYGLFINTDQLSGGNKVHLGPESYIDDYTYSSDINFYGNPSGTDFDVSTIAVESGVKVSHSLLSRARLSNPRGFELSYYDESDTSKDRFAITSKYRDGPTYEPLIIMLDKEADGIFGLTDLEHADPLYRVPKAMFHIQSTGNCDVRLSSHVASRKARLQLTRGSARATGVELSYEPDIFDVSLLKPNGSTGTASGVMSVSSTGVVIGSTQVEYASRLSTPATPLVISHPSVNSGTISLREQSSSPTNIAGFGSIFVKPYTYGGQQQSLFFRDDYNTEFNLIQDPEDPSGNLVYVDKLRNTHAGIHSPYSRVSITNYDNTTYGYTALSGVTTGLKNTAIGSAASALNTTGHENVSVGYLASHKNSTGRYNVVVGSQAARGYEGDNFNNCIVIGYRAAYNRQIPDSSLLIGTGNRPLVSGSLSSRDFAIDNGSLSVFNRTGNQTLKFRTVNKSTSYLDGPGGMYFYEQRRGDETSSDVAVIDVVDNDSTEFSQLGGMSLAFTKSDGQSGILMNFRHNADTMDYSSVTYHSNATDRPYAEVLGDLRLVGDIKFSDGTYLQSASTISTSGGYGISLNTRNGVALYDLDFTGLTNALSIDSSIDTENSFVSISIPSGVSETQTVTKLSIQGLTDLVESGFAAVSDNCNMLFTENDASIDASKNNRSVFIGCEAGAAATGWRNSVMIGTQAGQNATFSGNPNIHTDGIDSHTIFLGHAAGRDADNTQFSTFIGPNAGKGAVGSKRSMFMGSYAGAFSSCSNSIGLGEDALKSSPGGNIQVGSGNIEIITPYDPSYHSNERLFANTTSESARINIGNVFAGDMWHKRLSIGQAVLSPLSVLDVNHSTQLTPDGHTGLDHIQRWNSEATTQAAVSTHRCSGFMEVDPYGGDTLRPLFIEGFVKTQISAAPSQVGARSGLMDIYNSTSPGGDLINTNEDIYIVNRDRYSVIPANVYVVAVRVGCEYRPMFVGCSS